MSVRNWKKKTFLWCTIFYGNQQRSFKENVGKILYVCRLCEGKKLEYIICVEILTEVTVDFHVNTRILSEETRISESSINRIIKKPKFYLYYLFLTEELCETNFTLCVNWNPHWIRPSLSELLKNGFLNDRRELKRELFVRSMMGW